MRGRWLKQQASCATAFHLCQNGCVETRNASKVVMGKATEPQVLPPVRPQSGLTDESLDVLATVLDDIFHIPGTRIRFGIDPLVGLIPGLGDAITGFASFLLVLAAWQRGLPKVTVARMVSNIAVDSLMGALPFLGDLMDVAWKSNRRNLELLKRARYSTARKQLWHDWLFLLLIVVVIAGLVMIPILVLWGIVSLLR